jgi:2'-5' RNA ligase
MDHKREFGCLMAYVSTASISRILEFGKRLITDSILYEVPGEEYGRESEPHVTIKFGFSTDLTDADVKKIIGDTKKFSVTAEGLSTFNNDKFQVVKFDIKNQNPLTKMRKLCDSFPNEDSHPDYHPHLTLAYTKVNSFPHKRTGLSIPMTIDRMVYSPMTGEKRSYKLL